MILKNHTSRNLQHMLYLLLSVFIVTLECCGPGSDQPEDYYKESINQNDLINKSFRYLSFSTKNSGNSEYHTNKNSLNQNEINDYKNLMIKYCSSKGYCFAYDVIWLYEKFIKEEKDIVSHKIFEHIKSMIRIINWDGERKFTKEEDRKIYEYLKYVDSIQDQQLNLEQQIKDDWGKVVRVDSSDTDIVYTMDSLTILLKKILKPKSGIRISCLKGGEYGKHSLSIYQDADKQIFFKDSNLNSECKLNSINEVVDKLWNSSDPTGFGHQASTSSGKCIDKNIREFCIRKYVFKRKNKECSLSPIECKKNITDSQNTTSYIRLNTDEEIVNILETFPGMYVSSSEDKYDDDINTSEIKDLYDYSNCITDPTFSLLIKQIMEKNEDDFMKFLSGVKKKFTKEVLFHHYINKNLTPAFKLHKEIINIIKNKSISNNSELNFLSGSIDNFKKFYLSILVRLNEKNPNILDQELFKFEDILSILKNSDLNKELIQKLLPDTLKISNYNLNKCKKIFKDTIRDNTIRGTSLKKINFYKKAVINLMKMINKEQDFEIRIEEHNTWYRQHFIEFLMKSILEKTSHDLEELNFVMYAHFYDIKNKNNFVPLTYGLSNFLKAINDYNCEIDLPCLSDLSFKIYNKTTFKKELSRLIGKCIQKDKNDHFLYDLLKPSKNHQVYIPTIKDFISYPINLFEQLISLQKNPKKFVRDNYFEILSLFERIRTMNLRSLIKKYGGKEFIDEHKNKILSDFNTIKLANNKNPIRKELLIHYTSSLVHIAHSLTLADCLKIVRYQRKNQNLLEFLFSQCSRKLNDYLYENLAEQLIYEFDLYNDMFIEKVIIEIYDKFGPSVVSKIKDSLRNKGKKDYIIDLIISNPITKALSLQKEFFSKIRPNNNDITQHKESEKDEEKYDENKNLDDLEKKKDLYSYKLIYPFYAKKFISLLIDKIKESELFNLVGSEIQNRSSFCSGDSNMPMEMNNKLNQFNEGCDMLRKLYFSYPFLFSLDHKEFLHKEIFPFYKKYKDIRDSIKKQCIIL